MVPGRRGSSGPDGLVEVEAGWGSGCHCKGIRIAGFGFGLTKDMERGVELGIGEWVGKRICDLVGSHVVVAGAGAVVAGAG